MKNIQSLEDFLNESVNESKFIAFWQGKQIEIEGKDLWDAKQKAISQLKVPKSKLGLLAVVSSKSQENQDFVFETVENTTNQDINENEDVQKVASSVKSRKLQLSLNKSTFTLDNKTAKELLDKVQSYLEIF